jgi:DinB superfamily
VVVTPAERLELISRYAQGHQVVLDALAGATDAELDARPPEGWTAREVVHHLADSEMTSAIRLRRLLVEDSPELPGYDEEAFALRLRYAARPIQPALDALAAARATTLQILSFMSDTDWARAGTHTEHGPYSAEDWLRSYAAHAHDHANQIRRARQGSSPLARSAASS